MDDFLVNEVVNVVKEVEGIVCGNPVFLDACSLFAISQKDGLYLVISKEHQAVKDYIFLKEGQKVNLTGSGFEDKNIKGVIVVDKARIDLKNEGIQHGDEFRIKSSRNCI